MSIIRCFNSIDIYFRYLDLVADNDCKIFIRHDYNNYEYVADRKNYRRTLDDDINSREYLNHLFEEKPKIYYNIQDQDNFKFIMEAINISYEVNDISNILLEQVFNVSEGKLEIDKYNNEEINSEYYLQIRNQQERRIDIVNLNEYIVKIFIILKNILPNKFLSQPIKEALFLLSYELIRMNFYWMQVINCNIKSQHGIHNGWLTNLLTQLKGAQFWFKFDYLDFISKFDIAREYRDIIINVLTKLLEMRSESEKFWENISSLNNSIFFVNDNLTEGFRNADGYIRYIDWESYRISPYTSEGLEGFMKDSLKLEIQKLIEQLLNIETRSICDIDNLNNLDNKENLCGRCVVNYGDYKNDYMGIRHDTFIPNYLVVEYRHLNPKFFRERFEQAKQEEREEQAQARARR